MQRLSHRADYQLEHLAYEINLRGAAIARQTADEFSARNSAQPKLVAGVVGPTNRTASISPDVNDPAYRNTTFDELAGAYLEAARGLIRGRRGFHPDRDRV